MARVGSAASCAASSAARAGSASVSTTSETRPQECASAADSLRPEVSHSNARAGPRMRVTKYEPPESGTSPMLMKAGTKLADSAAMRTSQAQANDKPAPAAAPFTCDHGLLERSDRKHVRVVGRP